MGTITNAQVITRTKFRLGLTNTTLADAYLEKLINEGAQMVDSRQTYIISQTVIPIDCHKATLPQGVLEVIAYRFNTQGCSGCCMGNPNVTPGTLDVNMAPSCGCPMWYVANRNVLTNWNGYGQSVAYACDYFAVQGNYIQFPTSIVATEVTVYYRGFNTDCDGIMVLDERSERALSAYAAYQYSMTYPQNYAREVRAEWAKEWKAQKAWLRGTFALEDHKLYKTEAAAIARAILINPYLSVDRNL